RVAGTGLQLFDELVELLVGLLRAFRPELVYQRADEAWPRLAELLHQIAAAAGAGDRFSCLGEDALDLLVQLVAVGNDRDAGMRVVLQGPLREEHHHDALAASLGVPDDASLLLPNARLRRLDA